MEERNKQPTVHEQAYQPVFTVFTPTYNRAHTLHRVYESLQAQTYRNFEWVVIDDGSIDNTCELVEQWRQEANFTIRYFYQENSGKHIAVNRGVREAKGELFLVLDSDDACVSEALERFKEHWDLIPEDKKHRFSAVTCLCNDQNGEIVGSRFPFDPTDSDSLEIRYRYKVTGEKWGFHRTEVLRQFPFPEIVGEKTIPQGFVWGRIAREYKTRFINEPLRVYFSGTDQLTRLSPQQISLGHALWHKIILNEQSSWFWYAPFNFMRSAVHYSRFSFHTGITVSEQFKMLNTRIGKFLLLGALPVGYLVYCQDRKE
ncbi:glycosyltransferase family A protein [Coleofasciculus sp. FACHB-129]|uniref:glycosyltransferase family 2 protein n=1 Tax=Cyanophyceae TaxID=3028117 RepID=UPI0016834AE7|nr:glycosyltransferase family A protein [Coleofasciculus sp. FACHB-129]MBD1896893.1 glycosyltransferase family 2 protein [Coleofasciculus sp. FACHB-129]